MPRQKKIKELKVNDKGGIINFYEVIPAKYLNESENICVAYLNNEGHMEITILDDLLSKDMRPVYLKHILDQTDPKDYEKHHILDLIQVNKPGVIIPYFGNTQASDTEIALKVLEIYRKSRNIIADATVRGNFLRYRGRTICVDLDCALQRGSIASDTFMSEDMREQFEELWNKEYDTYPCTTDLIQTLFYLEEQLNPDEITDEYLTSELVGKFNMCRYNKIQLSILNIQTLMEIIQYCPENNNNNDLITLSLLTEIQSSTDQDRRKVILDAFSREGSFELAFFERWAMNNPLEIDELIAMGRDTACPFGFFQPNSSNQTDAVIKKARTQSPA